MANSIVWKVDRKCRIFSCPVETSICIPHLRGGATRFSHLHNGTLTNQFVAHCLVMLVDILSLQININESIAFITNGSVFCKLNLAEHHDGANNKGNGNYKLQYHQYFAWNGSKPTNTESSFQNFYWLK